MLMLQPIAQSGMAGFKNLIKSSADEITRRWVEAVRADRTIPSAEGMEEPILLDAVPLVLDEILRALYLNDSEIEHERICSAARHGRERAQEHFDVKELVREYQLLREHIFAYLRGDAAPFAQFDMGDWATTCQRLGLALDEAMRETINAFVEEHVLQLRRLSRTDSLTGLYNHRIFYERLADELNRARRYDRSLSLVLVDLDHFKSVNEGKGHQFGDRLLVKCAEQLRKELRQTDIPCRYGGDEFGLLLTETAPEDAHAMMSRLTQKVRELGKREGAPATFGMSFGLSSYPEDDGSARGMVKFADDRLLASKQKNKVGLTAARASAGVST
jgi:diguanylate cyclase (GGDEF)-like protein